MISRHCWVRAQAGIARTQNVVICNTRGLAKCETRSWQCPLSGVIRRTYTHSEFYRPCAKATSATTKKAALFPDLASSDLLAENVPSTPRRKDRAGDARGTQLQR